MGVSIDVWRARIGSYNSPGTVRSGLISSSTVLASASLTHYVGVMVLSLGLIHILLSIGGVESNPGPDVEEQFTCSFCHKSFNSVNSYAVHQKCHSNIKNFQFPCTHCGDKFGTVGAFNAHYSRFHRGQDAEDVTTPAGTFADLLLSASFICTEPTCQQEFRTFSELNKHMAEHLKNGFVVLCPYGRCENKFTKVSTFRTHVCQYHKYDKQVAASTSPIVTNPVVDGSICFSDDEEEFQDFSDLESDSSCDDYEECTAVRHEEICEVNRDDVYPENMVRDHCGRFYLWLEGELLIPSTKVQLISQEIATLTEMSHHRVRSSLRVHLSKAGLNAQKVEEIIDAALKRDTVYAVHHKGFDVVDLTTEYLREQYFKYKCSMLPVREIKLGKNDSGKLQFTHRILITDTLLMMFNDESIQEQIDASFLREEETTGIYQDFTDGSTFKEHPVCGNVKSIQIILFQDAYEFFPLGPTNGTYKSTGFYFTLGNIDPKKRSQVNAIQLCQIVKEKDLKYFGTEVCLEELIDELSDLAEQGIRYKGETLPVVVTHMCGDNLGQNFIGKFIECFTADYFCRFCEITRAEIRSNPTKTNPLRTPQDYDRVAAEYNEENPSHLKSGHKGLRGASAFNRIPFFHVSNPAQPPCIGHDILEGVAKSDLSLFLKYFTDIKKWITIPLLNKRIKAFKSLGRDAADSMVPVDAKGNVKGHASEVWLFVRMLPFLIVDRIQDENDPVWQLYLKLKLLCEYMFAPRIAERQLAKLKELIHSYVETRKALFNKELLPKHHLICHSFDLVKFFGPLIRLWTMRFEARHMFFKKAAKAANNFKNITKTLVNKYVRNLAYNFSGRLFCDDITFKPKDVYPVNFENLDPHVAQIIYESPTFTRVLQSVNICGIEYRPGLWVLLESRCKDLLVGEIVMVLYDGQNVKLIVKKHLAVNSFQGFYRISEDSAGLQSMNVAELPDYYSLPAYNFQGLCLSLKHSSPFMDEEFGDNLVVT